MKVKIVYEFSELCYYNNRLIKDNNLVKKNENRIYQTLISKGE